MEERRCGRIWRIQTGGQREVKNVRVHMVRKEGVGGHLEDTNRWAPGGKIVRVHGEASYGKNNLK
jgi:hypothetical protein